MLTDNTDITFTYNSRTNRFTNIYGFTGLLTSLTLQAFFLLTLLRHAVLKGLHWYKRFACILTLDKTSILLE